MAEEPGGARHTGPNWQAAWQSAQKLGGAVLLAYAFMLVLITASLHASVGDRLAALAEPRDFSSGHADWQNWEAARVESLALKQRRSELGRSLAAAIDDGEEARYAVLSEIHQVEGLRRRLSAVPNCAFLGATPADGDLDVHLADIRTCADGGMLQPAQSEAVDQLFRRAGEVKEMDRLARRTALLIGRYERDLQQLRDELAEQEALMKDLQPVRRSFDELDDLRNGPLPGAKLVGTLPPSVVHILLAFMSGMFGALLVTLVLVVYPKSDLKLSSPSGGYGARILLGGLISICVFVVLGGGTAVLGTSTAFADGEANYLAFCAIGILAGMFSDRVARWLSDRADSFFSRNGTEQPQ